MRPVAGIVRPRRDLVDQHAAGAVDEHLDREQADEVERRGDASGRCRRRRAAISAGIAGRGEGEVEDVVAVAVLDRRRRR